MDIFPYNDEGSFGFYVRYKTEDAPLSFVWPYYSARYEYFGDAEHFAQALEKVPGIRDVKVVERRRCIVCGGGYIVEGITYNEPAPCDRCLIDLVCH